MLLGHVLMPSLVLCCDVVMLSCWKQTLPSMASGHVVLELVSVSSWSMCSVVLSVAGQPTYFCMLSAPSCKSSLVASRITFSMYLSTYSRNWFLCLALVTQPASVHSLLQLLFVQAHQPVLVLLIFHCAFPLFFFLFLILSSYSSCDSHSACCDLISTTFKLWSFLFLLYVFCVLCYLPLLLLKLPAWRLNALSLCSFVLPLLCQWFPLSLIL